MKWFATVLGLALCLMLSQRVFAQDADDWTYDGPYGPQNWALLSDDFAKCAHGDQQSPINLEGHVSANVVPISLKWRATDWQVYNTGRSMHAQSRTAGHMVLDGVDYELVKIELHTPSEHAIDGEHFPMEVQFVHASQEDQVAIVSLMLIGGGRNPDFERLLAHTPEQMSDPRSLDGFDPTVLLTDLSDTRRYRGSLTKPPCSEIVTWIVITQPLVVSDAALTAFDILFGPNARPIQPTNRRYILSGRP